MFHDSFPSLHIKVGWGIAHEKETGMDGTSSSVHVYRALLHFIPQPGNRAHSISGEPLEFGEIIVEWPGRLRNKPRDRLVQFWGVSHVTSWHGKLAYYLPPCLILHWSGRCWTEQLQSLLAWSKLLSWGFCQFCVFILIGFTARIFPTQQFPSLLLREERVNFLLRCTQWGGWHGRTSSFTTPHFISSTRSWGMGCPALGLAQRASDFPTPTLRHARLWEKGWPQWLPCSGGPGKGM